MRAPGKPGVNLFARVDLETNERRLRLQEKTGASLPILVAEALRLLEAKLARRDQKQAS